MKPKKYDDLHVKMSNALNEACDTICNNCQGFRLRSADRKTCPDSCEQIDYYKDLEKKVLDRIAYWKKKMTWRKFKFKVYSFFAGVRG